MRSSAAVYFIEGFELELLVNLNDMLKNQPRWQPNHSPRYRLTFLTVAGEIH